MLVLRTLAEGTCWDCIDLPCDRERLYLANDIISWDLGVYNSCSDVSRLASVDHGSCCGHDELSMTNFLVSSRQYLLCLIDKIHPSTLTSSIYTHKSKNQNLTKLLILLKTAYPISHLECLNSEYSERIYFRVRDYRKSSSRSWSFDIDCKLQQKVNFIFILLAILICHAANSDPPSSLCERSKFRSGLHSPYFFTDGHHLTMPMFKSRYLKNAPATRGTCCVWHLL